MNYSLSSMVLAVLFVTLPAFSALSQPGPVQSFRIKDRILTIQQVQRDFRRVRSTLKEEQLKAQGMEMLQLDEPVCRLRASEEVARTHVVPPDEFLRQRTNRSSKNDCARMEVTYIGFEENPEARDAFQYAVDILESMITSPVPILIEANFKPLDPGVLGSAGPNIIFRDFPGAPQPSTWYASSLADKLYGAELASGEPDIIANFSSTFGWYFGRDGSPPPGTYDFVTVVLHELCHGLGFFGSAVAISDPILGVYGFGAPSYPIIYDDFVMDGTGTLLTDVASPGAVSAALGTFLQSENLFIDAPSAIVRNGNQPPAIYAPTTFSRGSSYAHWDEGAFPPGDPQSLMTPFLGFQESIFDPGDITLGLFNDSGWDLTEDCEGPGLVREQKDRCDITGISFDPLLPEPVCDIDGVFGPAGSHFICLRIDGIDPFNQPVDLNRYRVKVNGKDYPILFLGYDFFEGEQYFFLCVAGIPSDRKKNIQVKVFLEPGCTYTEPRLYDAPDCGSSSLKNPDLRAGLGNTRLTEAGINVFPNPSGGIVNLQTGPESGGEVFIFNAMGQLVNQGRINENDQREINLGPYTDGIYTIRVINDLHSFTRRIVLNR